MDVVLLNHARSNSKGKLTRLLSRPIRRYIQRSTPNQLKSYSDYHRQLNKATTPLLYRFKPTTNWSMLARPRESNKYSSQIKPSFDCPRTIQQSSALKFCKIKSSSDCLHIFQQNSAMKLTSWLISYSSLTIIKQSHHSFITNYWLGGELF